MVMCVLIRHLHIPHNTPCFAPKILHNLCFPFLLGITVVPRETEDNAHQCNFFFFWGGGGQTKCIMGDVEMTNSEKIQVARGIFHGIYHSKTLHNVYIKTIRYIFSKICNENFVGINMESQINSVLQITNANLRLFL